MARVMKAHLEHLQRKKKLRCSSRRRADSGRLTSMYEMVSSALSCGPNTASARLQHTCSYSNRAAGMLEMIASESQHKKHMYV